MISGSRAITTDIIKHWDEKLFFDILDDIQDVVMVLDSNTTIVYANQAYEKVLGIAPEKIIGKRLDIIEATANAIEPLLSGVPNFVDDYLSSVGINVRGGSYPIFENDKVIGCVAIFKNNNEVLELSRELERSREVAGYFQQQLKQNERLPLSFKEMGYKSNCMSDILELASKVALTNSTVMIRGESGVGKDVMAKAIYNNSKRADKPLIKVNCAAIPEPLLESELFGYDEGSFSGAKKGGKLGKFELAHGGTIFLDEIGDMNLSMQAKVLRVLQEKELERVGGVKTIKLDIRIISATNKDLEKMVAEGTFRRDLYYRLNIVPIYIPPLRERKDDLAELTQKLLVQISKKEQTDHLSISSEVLRIFLDYDWPGNVRELQNVLEYSVIVRNHDTIQVSDLPAYMHQKSLPEDGAEVTAYHNSTMKSALERLEKKLILDAISNCSNRSAAIRELGISRRTFYEKLKYYSIEE